jgi:DNA mismatch repair protein MutS2
MHFDETTSTPTFRLIPGIPGRSGGLEIAERLGLPPAVIKDARARRGHAGERISSYLARLHEISHDLEARLLEAREAKARIDRERADMESEFSAREARRREAVAAEIEMALKAMREEGERYLLAIEDRKLAAVLRRQEVKASAALRDRARTLIRQATGTAPSLPPAEAPPPGTPVLVEGMGLRGTLESVRGDRAVVVVRGKRMLVALADCRPVRPIAAATDRSPSLPAGVTLARKPGADAPAEIKLLGRTVDEALALVDKYLDDACLEGLTPIRIIHGVGSGRLKRAVADLLAGHPHVETFRSAPADEGGAGVTIVDLRN